MSNGYLIEFSGVDGSGKSTQAKLLGQQLSIWGTKYVIFDTYPREFFDLIRLHDNSDLSIREIYTKETAEVLMMCDEILHYNRIIHKYLDSGFAVICARSICDRYTKARVFGATNAKDIKKMENLAPCADIHFFLKTNLDTVMRRIDMRGTDNESPTIMERYIKLSDQEAKKRHWIILDGNRERRLIAEDINRIVQHIIG